MTSVVFVKAAGYHAGIGGIWSTLSQLHCIEIHYVVLLGCLGYMFVHFK